MSFTLLRYHLVFSTKKRRPFIHSSIERFLWKALRDKVHELGGKAFAINGVDDHVHLIVCIPATIAVSDFIRDVKAYASRVFKKECPNFAWAVGFYAATVSPWEMDGLLAYVVNQKQHHAAAEMIDHWEYER